MVGVHWEEGVRELIDPDGPCLVVRTTRSHKKIVQRSLRFRRPDPWCETLAWRRKVLREVHPVGFTSTCTRLAQLRLTHGTISVTQVHMDRPDYSWSTSQDPIPTTLPPRVYAEGSRTEVFGRPGRPTFVTVRGTRVEVQIGG